jgi:hypothetical protein
MSLKSRVIVHHLTRSKRQLGDRFMQLIHSRYRPAAHYLWVLTILATSSARGDEAWVKEWLAKPLLIPETPQAEVEKYCDARIPRMPDAQNREQWEQQAARIREEMLSKIIFRGEAARWKDLPTQVQWLDTVEGGEGYRIKKLRIEAVPGLWIPGLLYEPLKLDGKVPVSLNVNGHDSKGKATDYKQLRCINQVKRGMIALNLEWLGMGQLRGEGFAHSRMNQLDLCGTSGLAPFYLSMKRALDVLLEHPNADPARVAVSGLSGGGWQTIFISSLDTRVTLANPVAGYSSFITRVHHHSDLGDSEQTPCDMATVADYSHLTALLAPRAALLTYNIKDNCCFASDHALPPLLAAATPIYKLFEKEESLRSHINHDPGTHNFEQDNREAFYRIVVDHFFAGEGPKTEIESKAEVKTSDQLEVELPADNGNFNTLAKKLAKSLPNNAEIPGEPEPSEKTEKWRVDQREKLKAIARTKDYEVIAEKIDTAESDGVSVVRWRLKLSDTWTVPAVEFGTPDASSTTLLVADSGRAEMAAKVAELVKSGQRVVAVDPFYLGESKVKNRPYLFALLVATIGDRAMGLQASQLAATACWVKSKYPGQPVTLAAQGERSSLGALTAAALHPKHIDRVQLKDGLPTLKQVVEQNYSVDQKPELFCFGLLEQFDIPQLTAMVAPREVKTE